MSVYDSIVLLQWRFDYQLSNAAILAKPGMACALLYHCIIYICISLHSCIDGNLFPLRALVSLNGHMLLQLFRL